MIDIQDLLIKIIPPSDYSHRNGFNNIPLIEKLNQDEKFLLEDALIAKLSSESEPDMLIVETLSYLKSTKALNLLYSLIDKSKYEMSRLIISSCIFQINQDPSMIEVALTSFKKLPNIYYLPNAFYYLTFFKNPKVIEALEEYTQHKNSMVSSSAKRMLEL